MLNWMTQGLAQVVQKEATAQSRKASVLAAQRARGRARSAPNHHAPIPHVPIRRGPDQHAPVQHAPIPLAPIRQKSASPSPSHTEVS